MASVPKSLDEIDPKAMAAQYAVNAIGPALLLKHFATKLAKDRRAVFATLSARVGSIGDDRLRRLVRLPRREGGPQPDRPHRRGGDRAGAGRRRMVLALHPGTVETALTAKHVGRHPAVTPAEAAANLLAVIAGTGIREDGGGFFAWDPGRDAGFTLRPPDRSERALLTHSAPTSGV